MEFHPHSDKQELVLFSEKRVVVAATGIQWGKTSAGALWLKMMMHQYTDPADNFIITSPTYKILNQSTLPPFLKYMEGWGRHDKKDDCFRMHSGGTCWFRTGTDPDSVVGITDVRAILCDEAGLYSLYFWENIQARSSLKKAPIRIVTSPYSLNWLYKDIIRPKTKSVDARPDIDLVQASSKENPYFPDDEYEDKKRTMDPVRFQMMYGGGWGRMEGLVYKCFHEQENKCDAFKLPTGTRVVGGIDWGYTHPFVITVRAITPEGMHFQVGEFYKTGLTIAKKIEVAKALKQVHGIEIFYADPANPDDIEAFNVAGLPCVGADNSIRKGIDRHYELIATRRYKIFVGTSPYTEDEYEMYHYPEPKDVRPDQDDKEQTPVDKDNHCCDNNRYITVMTQHWGQKPEKYKVDAHYEQFQRLAKLKKKSQSRTTETW
jgi:PBSX family phage terminase large subunit